MPNLVPNLGSCPAADREALLASAQRCEPTIRPQCPAAKRLLLVVAAAIAGHSPEPGLHASDSPLAAAYRDEMEGPDVSWKVSADGAEASRLRLQERSERLVHAGTRAELVRIFSPRRGGTLYLEQVVDPALVFDELTASLWVRSNRPGVQLGVRLVFPSQIDPRTNEPLTADLWGETYTQPQRWQRLHCRTTDAEVRKLLGRVRHQVTPAIETADIDAHGMSVDQLVLRHSIEAGESEYALDALELTPFVDPASNGAEIVQTGVEVETRAAVTLGDGRLLRDGRPFFPVFTRHHQEPPAVIRDAGFNLLLIPDYRDTALLGELEASGLGAMCEPPAESVQPGSSDAATYSVGLPRFTTETSNILVWHLGADVPADSLVSVRAAVDAVRDADRFRRPLFVDVRGNVREFHRTADVVGFSKHTLHTSVSPENYFRFLQQESLSALRGKPTWTWVFTDPSPTQLEHRPSEAIVPQIEPEQIWMQVYAALGTGAKGIGYWSRGPLIDPSPAGRERLAAITLANYHIFLLRDWLATGKLQGLAPVRLGSSAPLDRSPVSQALTGPFSRLLSDSPSVDRLPMHVQAPVIQCEAGILILPQWLEPHAQFQPGAMRADDVRIQLRGLGPFTHAWEVTTTGVYAHELRVDDAQGGGPEIAIQHFDQVAAIVIPTDPRIIDVMRREVAGVREAAARQWIELAAVKLARVTEVHDALLSLEPPAEVASAESRTRRGSPTRSVSEADAMLSAARRSLQVAERALNAGDHDGARVGSQEVLRLTRIVQRAHWERAAGRLSSPVSTPYTICYQTLPDFWRMTQVLGRATISHENLLRAGSFEVWDSLIAADWKHHALGEADGVETLIELNSRGVQGKCLRLAARPVDANAAPAVLNQSPIVFQSEPVSVDSGQIVHVRGHVRIDAPVAASRNGLMVYDSLAGTAGALRWMSDAPVGQWIPFELLRPVQNSGDLRLMLELSGFGDVRFDELRVTVLTPEDEFAALVSD